jgi:hypothetical protein
MYNVPDANVFCNEVERRRSINSVHADVAEPQWPAIFAVQPPLAVCKASSDTTRALRVVRTVEEGNMLVADVTEPMDFTLVFEQA